MSRVNEPDSLDRAFFAATHSGMPTERAISHALSRLDEALTDGASGERLRKWAKDVVQIGGMIAVSGLNGPVAHWLDAVEGLSALDLKTSFHAVAAVAAGPYADTPLGKAARVATWTLAGELVREEGQALRPHVNTALRKAYLPDLPAISSADIPEGFRIDLALKGLEQSYREALNESNRTPDQLASALNRKPIQPAGQPELYRRSEAHRLATWAGEIDHLGSEALAQDWSRRLDDLIRRSPSTALIVTAALVGTGIRGAPAIERARDKVPLILHRLSTVLDGSTFMAASLRRILFADLDDRETRQEVLSGLLRSLPAVQEEDPALAAALVAYAKSPAGHKQLFRQPPGERDLNRGAALLSAGTSLG